MEFRHLTSFQVVAEQRSFSRAARILGYSQASITAHIQLLEAELGVPLFDRLGRQTALTETGQRFLGYAKRMLQLAKEAHDAIQPGDDPQGSVALSAPESICTYRLPALLQAARTQLPRVRLLFQPAASSELLHLIRNGSLDTAFVMREPLSDPAAAVALSMPEPIELIARPDHPLAQQQAVHATDLPDQAILLTEKSCAYRLVFEQALTAHGVILREALEFSSIEAIKQCVIAGLGISVLPAVTVARECEQGLLVALPWHGVNLDVVTQLVWHPERWQSPALSAFLNLARSIF